MVLTHGRLRLAGGAPEVAAAAGTRALIAVMGRPASCGFLSAMG